MTDIHDIIVRPVVSEKSYELLDNGVYTFVVHPDATKPQIKRAIEELFPGVLVKNVNTLNRKGKRRRSRRTGAMATLPSQKRAIVTLKEGSDEIEIFQAG